MRKFLNVVLLVPLVLVLVVFAVANRHPVTVSFDPFNANDPSLALSLPLFVVILSMAILGVIAGGIATWIAQRSWRRAARRHKADAQRAEAELADVRASLARQTMAERAQAAQAALPSPSLPAYADDRPRLTL